MASAPTAVRHIVDEHKRFLRTFFRFLAPRLRDQFEAHLQQMDVLVSFQPWSLDRTSTRLPMWSYWPSPLRRIGV